MANDIVWVAGAYVVGTFPSTYLIAKLKRSNGLLTAAGRNAGETDAHILMTKYLGAGWSTLAATADVLKALVFVLAARHLGGLPAGWLAVVGVCVVAGHSFPFYATRMAGRGMSASAGVLLVLLPWEMVAAGVVIVLGVLAKNSGLASTIGLATVPVLAALQGQPAAFVTMSLAIFALILARRLQGVREVIAAGTPVATAVLYRCLFDSSARPGGARGPRRAGHERRPRPGPEAG